jgi:hypothetical protein
VVEETLAQNHRRNMGGDDPSISAQTRFLTADELSSGVGAYLISPLPGPRFVT